MGLRVIILMPRRWGSEYPHQPHQEPDQDGNREHADDALMQKPGEQIAHGYPRAYSGPDMPSRRIRQKCTAMKTLASNGKKMQ